MVYIYAKELQGNTDKYVMKFVSEIVKSSVEKGLITLEDLYIRKEKDICDIFSSNFLTWNIFNKANVLITTNNKPKNKFYISFETKKRNTIPLVYTLNGNYRIVELSDYAKDRYQKLKEFKDSKYAYIKEIEKIY